MQTQASLKVYQKAFLFWAIYVVFHFAYKLMPVFPLALVCCVNESVFQHFKMGFFVYLLTSVLEYLIYRRRIQNKDNYWFSRLAATAFLPWIIFVLWYMAPAFYGEWPSLALEVIYSNIITIMVGLFAAVFERGLEQIVYSKPLKAVILTLFLISFCLYLIFTFKTPWADVFVVPKWK